MVLRSTTAPVEASRQASAKRTKDEVEINSEEGLATTDEVGGDTGLDTGV